ncbi:MAG: hypothetical protein ABJK11_07075 [Balneola sp.]
MYKWDSRNIYEKLYENCIATAEQEYTNGNYTYGVYLMFVDSACPSSLFTYVFEESEN